MNHDLINSIIKDTTDKASISDGEFTFGELHSDRLSLFVTLLNLLGKISSLKNTDDYLWVSDLDYEGKSTEGYIHIGYFSSNADAKIGGKVPSVIKDSILEMGAKTLINAPNYPRLNKALNFYINE